MPATRNKALWPAARRALLIFNDKHSCTQPDDRSSTPVLHCCLTTPVQPRRDHKGDVACCRDLAAADSRVSNACFPTSSISTTTAAKSGHKLSPRYKFQTLSGDRRRLSPPTLLTRSLRKGRAFRDSLPDAPRLPMPVTQNNGVLSESALPSRNKLTPHAWPTPPVLDQSGKLTTPLEPLRSNMFRVRRTRNNSGSLSCGHAAFTASVPCCMCCLCGPTLRNKPLVGLPFDRGLRLDVFLHCLSRLRLGFPRMPKLVSRAAWRSNRGLRRTPFANRRPEIQRGAHTSNKGIHQLGDNRK